MQWRRQPHIEDEQRHDDQLRLRFAATLDECLADRLLCRSVKAPGSTTWRHYGTVVDGQGNVVQLVRLDTGQVVANFFYSAYGLLNKQGIAVGQNGADALDAQQVNCDLLYQSKWQHQPSGLVNFGARFYNPATCKWMTRDPLREGGGLNLYGYVDGDPINNFDPDGLEEFTPTPATGDPYADFHNAERDVERKRQIDYQNSQINNPPKPIKWGPAHGTLSLGSGVGVNLGPVHGSISWESALGRSSCGGYSYSPFLLSVGGGPGVGFGFSGSVFAKVTNAQSVSGLLNEGQSTGASGGEALVIGYERVESGWGWKKMSPINGHSVSIGVGGGLPLEAHHNLNLTGGLVFGSDGRGGISH